MFMKYCRYCPSFTSLWKTPITKVILLICYAAILATLYTWYCSFETKLTASHNESKVITGDLIAAVLVICASRPEAIENHMNIINRLRKSATSFPVVISQDGRNEDVHRIARNFTKKLKNVSYIQHNQSTVSKPYGKIAAHYKFALDYMFMEKKYEYVIITEDDLELGTDFFSYFTWGRKLLETDPTIWCISAWNDNGITEKIDATSTSLTWRSDFFPGLGWMLSRTLWEELSPIFPASNWDDWLRRQEVNLISSKYTFGTGLRPSFLLNNCRICKGRSCIRPEIARTSHNMLMAGRGTSGGMFEEFLSQIHHSESVADFALNPIEGMVKENYDATLTRQINDAKLISMKNLSETVWNRNQSYRIIFDNMGTWPNLAAHFGLMSDVWSYMPRTAYCGIVTTVYEGCRVFMYPQSLNVTDIASFKYDPDEDKKIRYLEFQKMYCRPGRWTRVCDPYSREMKDYFRQQGWTNRLPAPGEMIIV